MAEITVLIPVYNGMPYLREAVQSVLDQSWRDWRCVIVDDGSTDGTGVFLESLGDKRFVVLRQENAGIAAAVNHGLQHCDSRYIARLDADDVALPTRLAEQVRFLEANPETGLLGTQIAPFGERRAGGSLGLPLDHETIMSDLLAGRHAVAHSAIMVRTELLRRIGGYWSLPYGEEYDMMLRLGEASRLANLDRVLLHYRMHSASMNGMGLQRMRFCIAYACELARRRQEGLPPVSLDEFQSLRAARPWWKRAAENVELHGRRQYRIALAERYGGHHWRGTARLAWAAACAPQLTVERIARTLRRPHTPLTT